MDESLRVGGGQTGSGLHADSQDLAQVQWSLAVETCLYTNRPDERFLLERRDRVVVASACSGHGFKFAPIVGRTLAGLARADQVATPGELIDVLDDVSRYQGDLARFSAWQPEVDGSRITLAMRALATVDSPYKSSEQVLLEEKKLKSADDKPLEEDFPNARSSTWRRHCARTLRSW